MLFLYRVSQFFFWGSLLSMLIGTADQLFGLGVWHGAYPPIQHEADGSSHPSTYWEFMGYAAGAAIIGLIGMRLIMRRVLRRYARLLEQQEARPLD